MLNSSDPDYTDARLRIEAWNVLVDSFAETMYRSNAGYWRQLKLFTLVVGQRGYRLPARALANAVEFVEVMYGSDYRKLHFIEIRDVGSMESALGNPNWYTVDGDYINIYPLPTSAITMRVKFAIRPSTLVAEQTAGRITAVVEATRVVTVNSAPIIRSTTQTMVTGDLADVVHPNGGFELGAFDCSVTVSGTSLTFPSGTDMSRIAVGDYVRGAQETDWPMLPVEFHRTLADATAAVVCVQRGLMPKAQALASMVGPQMERLRNIIQPRVKFDPAVLRRRNLTFRRGFGNFPGWGDP
jgi:hypothetical protein